MLNSTQMFASSISLQQDKILYLPYLPPGSRGRLEATPENFHMDYEDWWVRTQDGVDVHCWFVKAKDRARRKALPIMVYFHGNAGNISHRLGNIRELVGSLDVHVLIVSYRGYGLSTGTPSEKGMMLDADAVMERLLKEDNPSIDKKSIIMFGRSLGGSVAIYAANRFPENIRVVIVENTFLSVPDMLPHTFPVLGFLRPLVRSQWRNIDRVTTLPSDLPVLFLSGQKDEIVPPFMMASLFEKCSSEKKRIEYFSDGHHNETWLSPDYNLRIHSFLREHIAEHFVHGGLDTVDVD
jgi:abhydrolase domain-containing protein 13